MVSRDISRKDWIEQRIKPDEYRKYLDQGQSFIDDKFLQRIVADDSQPDPLQVRDILQKSLEIESLTEEETAVLTRVQDPDLLATMEATALKVKKKVYDNRIVTFAPLYLNNICVNNCLYCGFRTANQQVDRKILSSRQIRDETRVLAGEIGHKRLIVVYGEAPETDIDYMEESIETIYSVKVPVRNGEGRIRRVNLNAPPLQKRELERLKTVGIGTYQVFQETYHAETYHRVHPGGTLKNDYLWRLYSMHRAYEAGVDDFGLGVLFGLYDWRYELLGLVSHARELEEKFGVGPHTISFPRLEPALGAKIVENSKYRLADSEFKRLITVLRLAVPYTGLIITARESAALRDQVIELGCTQADASTKLGIGGYSYDEAAQSKAKQQFIIGDTRSLDSLVRSLIKRGYIVSFCTAGYRCGRTGESIMKLLKTGKEGEYCKLNAVLTFREWLDDFASEETRVLGERLIQKEISRIKQQLPEIYSRFQEYYSKTVDGKRDLFL